MSVVPHPQEPWVHSFSRSDYQGINLFYTSALLQADKIAIPTFSPQAMWSGLSHPADHLQFLPQESNPPLTLLTLPDLLWANSAEEQNWPLFHPNPWTHICQPIYNSATHDLSVRLVWAHQKDWDSGWFICHPGSL